MTLRIPLEKFRYATLLSALQKSLLCLQNEWWLNKAQEIQSYADRNDMHNFYNSLNTAPRSCSITPEVANTVPARTP